MAEKLILEMDAQYKLLENRVLHSIPLTSSPTAPMPPPLSRSKVKGILAYRVWNFEIKGSLAPAVVQMDLAWKHETTFSDHIPDMDSYSQHGLYAHRLEYFRKNNYESFVSGVVDLYGTVIEHSDGVMRAECARILCIILTITNDNELLLTITRLYENLKLTYPLIPVYILSPFQRDLFLYREVIINYNMLQGVYPYGL